MIIITKKSDQMNTDDYSTNPPDHMLSGIVNWRVNVRSHVWHPTADVYETNDDFVVRTEVAGMAEDGFSICLENNMLSITGLRQDDQEKRAFHQMEIHFGEFKIEVEIPMPVQVDQVRAEYSNGFLKVILPKEKPRKININDE